MSILQNQQSSLAFQLLKASKAISQVIRQKYTLDHALGAVLADVDQHGARGAIADLSYYGLRSYGLGGELVRLLSSKPNLKPVLLEDFLILCGSLLADPNELKYPTHTLVDQAVKACKGHPKLNRASGFVNGCLRHLLRNHSDLLKQATKLPVAYWNFPAWWIEKLRSSYPDHWQLLLEQANTHPPMVLRVNRRVCDAMSYKQLLKKLEIESEPMGSHTLVLMRPVAVDSLPGFQQGHVSVQDSAAQMAVALLKPKNGQRVLDCCAAPGGKTGHLLEWADIDLLALDSQPKRLEKVHQNYQRIQPTLTEAHSFRALAVKAQAVSQWWDGKPFDLILADLPCSGSGVVRRHPEIRWLRKPDNLLELSQIQHTILDSLWPTLNPGGTLLLVTCSIFYEEGSLLTEAFLAKHSDARLSPASPGVTLPTEAEKPYVQGGRRGQRFQFSPDGFYYALLTKATLD